MFTRGNVHVRRANHQRHDVIAERRERQRHNAQKHHDRSVHRTKGIVKVGGNRPPCRRLAQHFFQQRPDDRHRRARMRDLPAHQQHQEKSEQHEHQCREAILNADDLVVGGENIFLPEARLVMRVVIVAVMAMMFVLLAIRRKLLNDFIHITSFDFIPDHRHQQQRQINDRNQK